MIKSVFQGLTKDPRPAAAAIAPEHPPELLPVDSIDAVGHKGSVAAFMAAVWPSSGRRVACTVRCTVVVIAPVFWGQQGLL